MAMDKFRIGNATKCYVNTGGIYLHRQPIPINGSIVAIDIFGFENTNFIIANADSFLSEPSEPPPFPGNFRCQPLLVYRECANDTVHELVHGPKQQSIFT